MKCTCGNDKKSRSACAGVLEQGDRTLLQPDIDIPNGTPIR